MEILVGREEGARRLHCRVDNGREFYIGQVGTVPLSVSRKHCRILINGGSINIENLNLQNDTYVDGNQVFSKAVVPTSRIELGRDRFLLPLQQILQLVMGTPAPAQGSVPRPAKDVPTFSLVPLKAVWDEYEQQVLDIQNRASKRANQQRLQGILSLLGVCVGLIPSIDGGIRIIIVLGALALAVYFFYKGSVEGSVAQQIHDLNEELAKKYRCPNPKCGRPFGTIPYRNIEYNKQCFSCGCKYTH